MADAVVSLGLDPVQFEAGLKRAERSSGAFAQRLGGMLGRTLGAVFVGGSIIGALDRAIDQVTTRRAAIQKALTGPESSGFRSGGDIQGNLSETVKQIKGLTDLRNFDSSNGFRRVIANLRDSLTGETPQERDDAKTALRGQASQDIDALARRQEKLNDAQRERQFGEERTADLLEEEAKWMDNLYQLAKAEAEAGVNNNAARQQENERNRIANSAIEKKHGLKQAEAEAEIRLGILRIQGISDEKLLVETLRERLALKERELRLPGSNQRRDEISAERLELQSKLRSAQFAAADQSPDAVRERNAANLENLKRRAFDARMTEMEDPRRVAYGAIVSGIGAVGPQTSGEMQSTDLILGEILSAIRQWTN